jgi:ABC-2 type transport system permease protein
MSQSKRAWFYALKNLRLFVTDRTAVIMFILFPFLFIVMFNILMSNTGSQDTRLELHLATQETNGLSQHIIQSLVTTDDSHLKPGDPKIVWEKDYNLARADVETKKLAGFLAFPADFTQNLQVGKLTNLEIVVQADDTNMRAALNGFAQGIAARLQSDIVTLKSVVSLLQQEGATAADIQQAAAQVLQHEGQTAGISPVISYQIDSVGQVKPLNPSSYVVPGYLVMFVFFASAIAAVDIIRVRQNHTLERLLASSVRKETILGGIYLGAVLKGLVQIAIFWTFGILVFHVDMGFAPWAVIVISLLMVIMSAGFSLMLATLVKTDRSASAIAVLCTLLLAPLGGCWWPLFIAPQWMQFLAKFTPHGWANAGFDKLLIFGASGGDVLWEMLALAGFAVAFIIVALINFRTSADAV